MITSTAWKNVWRNKTRSLVVIISVTIGIFGGIFAVAVMNGAIQQRLEAALDNELGHIQITRPDFRENYDIHLTLDSISGLDHKLMSVEGVQAVTHRTIISAMANTASKSTGVQVIGIDPEMDRQVFRLDQQLIPGTGSYFGENAGRNPIYIGEDLAKELNIIRYIIEPSTIDSLRSRDVPESVLAKLKPYAGTRFSDQESFTQAMKDTLSARESSEYGRTILQEAWSFRKRTRLTLTFLDKDNIQTGGMFRITGIYDIKNKMYETGHVFVLNSDIQRITGLPPGTFHMAVVRIADSNETKSITSQIAGKFPQLDVKSWKEIAPDMAMMNDMVTQFYIAFMIIILAALAFGIVNTMLMVVLERTKELGMLTAIGMNKKRVFRMIMTESVFLSLIGGVVGMAVSWIAVTLTSRNGINFVKYGEGFEALGFSSHIYPDISFTFFIMVTILIVITGILSSIYPALKALKLDPAEALRTE